MGKVPFELLIESGDSVAMSKNEPLATLFGSRSQFYVPTRVFTRAVITFTRVRC